MPPVAACPILALDFALQRGAFCLQVQQRLQARVTGILGPSGAGKSTLLAVLAGLLRPTQGTVHCGASVWSDAASGQWVPPWQRRVGWVLQDHALFPHLSVAGNLRYGWQRRRPAERVLGLQDVVDLLELRELLRRAPQQLSGGERQRVAIGRALLSGPRLLLLDEPVSALDGRLRGQILDYLCRIRDTLPLPMVYVSHIPAEVERVADSLLVLEDGRLRAY